jgi:succinate dehydrogenase / fumarate reductase membrane anchor subunit
MSRDQVSPLKQVMGKGSAHEGGAHWLEERMDSAALLLLGLWFIVSLLLLPALDRATVVEWLRKPSGAVPMALFVILVFRHAMDGIKVSIDDYVHDGMNHLLLTMIVRFVGIAGMAFALFSLAKIVFGA